MKKTTSFHLEEDIIEEIEAYKKKYNLSSRNVALERMLLERRNIISFPGLLTNNQVDPEQEEIKISQPNNDKLKKSIDNSYSDMPD